VKPNKDFPILERKTMTQQTPFRVLFLTGEDGRFAEPFQDYLKSSRTVYMEVRPTSHLPGDLGDCGVLLLSNPAGLSREEQERLTNYAQRGGGCLGFAGPSTAIIPPLFGAQIGPASLPAELRLTFGKPGHSISKRLPNEIVLHDCFQPLDPVDASTEPILAAAWQYQKVALALLREEGKGRVVCTTLKAFGDPLFQQILYRVVLHLGGIQEPPPLGVAVLGYGPLGSVGSLHGLAVKEVPGLHLRAFCDYSSERLLQCRGDFPGCQTYSTAEELGRDPEVAVVIIATPPNSHAELAIQMLREGKHVVCEKPICLSRAEAETMIQAAKDHQRVLTCYQNRRWDADYLAISQALTDGLIGEPFYLETFVGDYRHPCHYWHSHRPISGDALYDWGAHYVDWILNLFPGPTASVTGTSHKRVWHDVTNADQVRAQIHFADGREAEFLYSDVAGLRKPKWYLLGTEGAIVGRWSEVKVRELDPVTFVKEEQIPVTETPPLLMLRRRHHSGGMAEQQMPLPKPRRFPFHLNLADHLLTGEPLAVSPQSAARVIAVLEAATRSAERGGVPEVLRV
jgi:predicted dehydrogenase